MTDDPLIGRKLANYRIERLLGRGGMATVYYATDVRLNRPVAVKVIEAHFRTKESYTARFIQEARAVAVWRHEHIVQIYYAGDEDGLYYFAMEYIDGTTLAKTLADQAAQGTLLPPADVLRYGRAIASALDYAHRKGVIHRDVKPLNVLVSSDGRVVLADFGLALDTAQGSLGEVFGSAHYTAPEQARRSNAAVPQSDLYSLGVILYEMLTGVVPFDDPSPTSVALQQITLDPPPPRQINPDLSPASEAVLLRALSKDPAARYQSGEALMDALEAALQGQPAGRPAVAPQGPAALPPVPAGLAHPPSGEARSDTPPAVARPMVWLSWMSLVAVLCLVLSAAAGFGVLGLWGRLPARNPTPTVSSVSAPAAVQSTGLPLGSPTMTSPTALPPSAVPLQTASPTPEPSPTARLSPLPSDTPAIVASPTPGVPPPSPTLKYSDRRRFVLYYNETGFYMQQTSSQGDLIGGVAFERLDANLQPLDRFSGNRWAKYSSSSRQNWCFRLEISGAENYLNPPECRDQYLATLHLDPTGTEIFWTPQEDGRFFRVLWHGEELVRCEIPVGTCEVYLP